VASDSGSSAASGGFLVVLPDPRPALATGGAVGVAHPPVDAEQRHDAFEIAVIDRNAIPGHEVGEGLAVLELREA
jgi:hypothetical protein